MSDLKIGFNKDLQNFDLIATDGNNFISAERFRYIILERPDKIIFEKFGQIQDYENWEHGRLFGDNDELKWDTINGKKHAVITSETNLPDTFEEFRDFTLISKHDTMRELFLWGEKQYDKIGNPQLEWYEPKIPQILKYPAEGNLAKNRVILKIQEYTIEETIKDEKIVTTIHRYIGLEEI